jgi:hypothetical protein
MSKRITILILLTMLSGSAINAVNAAQQEPLPAEKKKGLHKLDPGDIFAEAQESKRKAAAESASRRRQGRGKPPASLPSAVAGDAATTTSTSVVAPTPSLTATVSPSPIPSATLTPTPAPQITPSLEPVVTPTITAVAQSSDSSAPVPPESASSSKPTGPTTGMSLPVIFTLLCLILIALFVAVFKLKKQLRTP